MKILLIGKHPKTGGAAIASRRLMEALKARKERSKSIRFLFSSDAYEKLSADTRDLALKRFSKDRSVEMHIDLYRKLVNEDSQS